MKKVIIASNNKGKIKEFKEMLELLGYECISQHEAGIKTEVEENGETFAQNAFLKADYIFSETQGNYCVLADDSGLCIDALNGEPGVYSARYGGLSSDKERCELILKKLKGEKNRKANFVCSLCFIKLSGEKVEVEGRLDGEISQEPIGENGFGYDPIFMYGKKSLAELSADEKNKISHRANALKNLIDKLKEKQ